jgi:(p)ppGpp synthase/HD superfamily hydrolase
MASTSERPCSAASVQRILAAARFAAEKHVQQKRKGALGEPYLNHLVEVADLVAASNEELDTELVMAAFLHDVIEDTSVTFQELENLFGRDVADLVAEVTDDKSLSKEMRKHLQVQNAHKKSERAQILLRSIVTSPPLGWNLERRQQYFEWARQVVVGLKAPNRFLKAEFDKTYAMISQLERT